MKKYNYQEVVFNSKWLSKFMNSWFFIGKKNKIENLIYFSLYSLKKCFNINAMFFFFEALEKLKPWIGLKVHFSIKSKKEKKAYPIILKSNVQYKKAIYWLVKSIQLRKELLFSLKFKNEIKNIVFNNLTNSLKKKKEYYHYAILFKAARKFKW